MFEHLHTADMFPGVGWTNDVQDWHSKYRLAASELSPVEAEHVS